MAQLERDMIAERVKAGRRRAKERGGRIGRPKANVDFYAIGNLRSQNKGLRQISQLLGIPKSTVADVLKS